MPRIVAGAARGRVLAVAPGGGTRPTTDRAREGLFSTVTSVLGDLSGSRVLDLYAGSGAVGLEALSRGAHAVLLVERDPRAVRVLRDNVRRVGLPGAAVRAAPVSRVVADPPDAPYDLVVADPPYDSPPAGLLGVLAALLANGWLAADALVVVERSTRGPTWAWPPGFTADRERRYGETVLCYGRAAMGTPPPASAGGTA